MALVREGSSLGIARRPGRRRARRERVRQILARLATVLIGLLVPLLVLELAFRFVGPVLPGDYQTAQLVAVSEAFGRQNMANRAGWKRSDEFRVHVRVNSKGLRGPEIPYQKPAGVFRVLVVGDSFTFAAQVEEDQTFVTQLGEQLRESLATGGAAPFSVETINAGVDGWNTVNEVAWLRSEGFRYEPDLVVLMFYTGNDPGENYDTLKAVRRLGVDTDPAARLPGRELRRWLADTSALYAYLETGVVAKIAPVPEASSLADLSETARLAVRRSTDPYRKEHGWEMSGDLLREMRELCDERGAGVLVVGIPTLEHVINADRPPTPMQEIAEAARTPVLDLLMSFRAEPDNVRDALYFPKDRHWTPAGHQVASRQVAAELQRRGLVPSEASRP